MSSERSTNQRDVPLAPWAALWRELRGAVADVWSMTHFDRPDVVRYAEGMMLEEMRKGLMLMAGLSLAIQLVTLTLHRELDIDAGFGYTYGLLALLSLHVVVSARLVHDTRALNLLGTILLVITGVAIMGIAHRTGSLGIGVLASVVPLFMVMPLVPWGLRDAALVVVLIYAMFTLSALSGAGRFESQAVWALQFLIVASATTAVIVIARNTRIRKNDIRARYELEAAHDKLQLLTTRDPLTGAWNRRYLEQSFASIAAAAQSERKTLHFAVLDVDVFKTLNDSHGHHFGDEVLRRLVRVMLDNLPGTAHVLRLGGDEFAALDTSDSFESTVRRCLQHLETDPHLLEVNGGPVRVSLGLAAVAPGEPADLDRLYRAADAALYAHKRGLRKVFTGPWHVAAPEKK